MSSQLIKAIFIEPLVVLAFSPLLPFDESARLFIPVVVREAIE